MLVFQYGSNCLESQVNSKDRLCGDAKFIDIAETVVEFELAFDVWSCNRACAASDIVRKPGGRVWGVLYKVPDYLIGKKTANARGRKSFDQIEGSNYKREEIDVRRSNDSDLVRALTYIVKCPKPGLKTSIDYVRYIICGLRERGVDNVAPQYIAKVKKIATANNPNIAAEVAKL